MANALEIEYIEPKKEFRVGSVKNIAVPSNNVNDIKKMYPGSKKTESNADMLSQSFGKIPEVTPIPTSDENLQAESVDQPVQISPIPVVQNTNLEKEPVSLETSATTTTSDIPTIEPDKTEEEQQPSDKNVIAPVEEVIVNPIKSAVEPKVYGIESEFKVSSAGNIFDNPVVSPINTTNEEINKPIENIGENSNITTLGTSISEAIPELNDVSSDIKDDMISAEIAILEKNVKLYEELAENNRKMIELKKKKIKKEENDVNLENTASNLFNNNGVLDDDKVLGKTPMPNLRAA